MKNKTAMPIKMTLAMTGALYGLLLGAAVSAQPASQTAPHVEPAASASAHTPTHTPAHVVTLYGLTLGEVLPQLPECTDRMLWYSKGDGPCIEYADGMYSTMGPHLKYGTADEVGIYFPEQMMVEGYPKAIAVGLDKEDRMVYFGFYVRGLYDEITGLPPEMTHERQQQYVEMVNQFLGKPDIYVVRTRVKDDPIDDMALASPPGGVSQETWSSAEYGAIMAAWHKDGFWGRYIGKYGENSAGYLEMGLRSMFTDGNLPR